MSQFLARPSQTSDPWGRYYTSPEVSRLLIDEIETTKPRLVLELGSGAGSLSEAAANRWKNVKLVTVDVDRGTSRHFDGNTTGTKLKHSHFIHDVLAEDLSDKIGLALGTVDVAVCNPPYIRPKWRSEFGKILECAGLSDSLSSIHDAGADLLFLAQNLRLLRHHGKLGLILPDGLITAEKFNRVRQILLRQHRIEQVVQLPRRVFKGTEAQTYLAVLSKMEGETDKVTLKQVGRDGLFSPPIEITQDAAAKRLDYAFHARLATAKSSRRGQPPVFIRNAASDVLRGTICSSEINSFATPVFHLGNFPARQGEHGVRIVPNSYTLSDRAAKRVASEARIALPGDILLARVGRSLEDHIALVVHGPCVISDCIFAVRTTDEYRERLYRFFESDLGRNSLASSAHGVAARFLSKTNLLDIQF